MTSIEQSAAAMARYVAELERRVAELEALNAECNRQNAAAFAECDRLRTARERMSAKLMELAGGCAECDGSGLVTVRGMCGGVEMDCDDQPCPDCADIRESAMGWREGE